MFRGKQYVLTLNLYTVRNVTTGKNLNISGMSFVLSFIVVIYLKQANLALPEDSMSHTSFYLFVSFLLSFYY